MIIKEGTTILLTFDSYEDYVISGLYLATRNIDTQVELDSVILPDNNMESFFRDFLIGPGALKSIEYTEVNFECAPWRHELVIS